RAPQRLSRLRPWAPPPVDRRAPHRRGGRDLVRLFAFPRRAARADRPRGTTPSPNSMTTLAGRSALADRHPGDSFTVEVEGERGPPVGIGRGPVTDDGDPVALGRDLFGCEDAGGSDEFPVTPGLDGLTSGEFPPPVIDDAARGEGVEEALLIVGVDDVDEVGDDGRDLRF